MRRRLLTATVLLALSACGDASDEGRGPVSSGSTCFSPTQNLDDAYEEGAMGCPCTPGVDASVCVADSTHRLVALICDDVTRTWRAVEDGPCGV